MATIALQDGKVILKDGKASCTCCESGYDSAGGCFGYISFAPVGPDGALVFI
jgi:hypothetical protein